MRSRVTSFCKCSLQCCLGIFDHFFPKFVGKDREDIIDVGGPAATRSCVRNGSGSPFNVIVCNGDIHKLKIGVPVVLGVGVNRRTAQVVEVLPGLGRAFVGETSFFPFGLQLLG